PRRDPADAARRRRGAPAPSGPGRPAGRRAGGRRSPGAGRQRTARRGRHARLQPEVRKMSTMPIRSRSALAAVFALSLGLGVSGCGDLPNNRTLYSVKQPVVERSNFTLDLTAGAGGLAVPEQHRLADWFKTMDLGYGDRVAIDAATTSEAAREDVAAIASRYGILLSDGVPVTPGFVEPGMVRVVVTRSRAYVPGCPDW